MVLELLSYAAICETALAGSPTSHSALPAPLPFPLLLWGLRPDCLWKGTGVRSSRNRTFVQFGLDTLKSPV